MRILTRETVFHEKKEVELAGWVDVRRDHGKLIFVDLRDRAGIIQLVFLPNEKTVYEEAQKLRSEWVIRVKGIVNSRPEKMWNPKIETGKVELQVTELEILNEAETPPFPLDTPGYDVDEEVRLKYRYLDLRRQRLQRNIRMRSEFIDRVRQFLFKHGFAEIETPLLTKSTPEGSRDFVVPSRIYPGKFFALPQSPQQYKQLLMASAFERYFQIAKCIRDEDLRADRGFEFTQIDLEMSFVDRQEVMALDEAMMIAVFEGMGYRIKEKPFPVFTYAQAMEKFKADKFDLRSEEDKKNGVLAFAWVVDFPFFEKIDPKEAKSSKYAYKKADHSSALHSEALAKEWTFTHNPFSIPKPEHVEWLLKGERIGEILTTQYDLVCNGYEVGGGSIRAHKPELLKAVFKVMGYPDEVIQKQFGHMLEAFKYGTPPHGGLAHGVERLIMILTGEQYLREVQAFPQTSSGRTSIMEAPAEISETQLKELGLEVAKQSKK